MVSVDKKNKATPSTTPSTTPKSKKNLKKQANSSAKKAATATPKQQAPVLNDDKDVPNPKTYVSNGKVVETIKVLKQLQDDFEKNIINKKPLFEENHNFVFLHFLLKKCPLNFSTFIHSVSIPFHWRHQFDFETCLIVKDVNRKPLTDRDADIVATKSHYQELLESLSVNDLVNEILPMRQLKNEFRPPALRKKLASEYGAFLCDKKLIRNKFSFLSSFLGKAFWIDRKKVPILVDLNDPDLKGQLESKLDQTQIYVSGKGASLSVCVGSLKQDINNVAKNTEVVLEKLQELFSNNVRSLSVKTEKSPEIMFYMDLGSSNEIRLTKPQDDGEKFVEDEFDFLTNTNVRVYRDGNIRILDKQKKKTAEKSGEEEDDETTKSEKKAQDDEVASVGEQKFVEKLNKWSAESDQWIRRKVTRMPKRLNRSKRRPFVRSFRRSTTNNKQRQSFNTNKDDKKDIN